MESTNNVKKISNKESEQQTLLKIADLIKNIRYGYIQIIIQDGRVVQIDKTEKFRFNDQKSK
ncbi:MAG: YezD family protein [Candidatus Scalindua sp.]|nr:YezD family protein [Candidatus Scalindua sp.]MCR4343477.1 YezD family protein [Candidatus Scalindua sp.]